MALNYITDDPVFQGFQRAWTLGERQRTESDLTPWRGNRAGAGKSPPNGFPKTNRFE